MPSHTVLYLMLFCIWIADIEAETPVSHDDFDVVVSVFKKQNRTAQSSTQVNLMEAGDKIPGNQYRIQVNVDNGSETCSCASRNDTKKPEPPRPFYEFIPGMGYYKLHTKYENWYNAKHICESEGTHLAIMNSLEEIGVLQEFWRRRPNVKDNFKDNFIYLGVHVIGTAGIWRTIFDIPLQETGFMEWDSGQPQKRPNEDCICIKAISGKLHDCHCIDPSSFFCEKEIQ